MGPPIVIGGGRPLLNCVTTSMPASMGPPIVIGGGVVVETVDAAVNSVLQWGRRS